MVGVPQVLQHIKHTAINSFHLNYLYVFIYWIIYSLILIYIYFFLSLLNVRCLSQVGYISERMQVRSGRQQQCCDQLSGILLVSSCIIWYVSAVGGQSSPIFWTGRISWIIPQTLSTVWPRVPSFLTAGQQQSPELPQKHTFLGGEAHNPFLLCPS